MNKKINIIGSGFSSLASACYLAKAGFDVTIFEKNEQIGGRARQLKKDGFTFDIGPTFYWMPDVFEEFFKAFGKKVSDYYQLDKLAPAYEVSFGKDDSILIGDNLEKIKAEFERIEPGSSITLQKFIDKAKVNYDIAIKDLVYKPGNNIFELVQWDTATKLGLFIKDIKSQIAKNFTDPRLRMVMEFPVLFLGAKPSNTPAFYNFMNYADFGLGTWHPKGGMYSVVEAMITLSKELGVTIKTNENVEEILLENGLAKGIKTNTGIYNSDIVLSGADYAHSETLLPAQYRQYTPEYWNKKTFAPSAMLFYVGFDKKLDNIHHHTLFFDSDFEVHASEIYDLQKWPTNPLFYASFPSLTDDSVSPVGKEAGIFLIPLAPGLEDSQEMRQKYFDIIIDRLEINTKQEVKKDILFWESYCVSDFIEDYNSYKGNAYGLANTLMQTHVLRPKLKSKKVKNLYFTGQLTVPGPGVPPSLISGKIVSELIEKHH